MSLRHENTISRPVAGDVGVTEVKRDGNVKNKPSKEVETLW